MLQKETKETKGQNASRPGAGPLFPLNDSGCALSIKQAPGTEPGREWSERQDLNLRRLGPKPSALARLSYAPTLRAGNIHKDSLSQRFFCFLPLGLEVNLHYVVY